MANNKDFRVKNGIFVGGNITVEGTVDNRDLTVDGTKLDNIEIGATADQTASEIKVAYESNVNTNAFTDSEKTKLSGIEAGGGGTALELYAENPVTPTAPSATGDNAVAIGAASDGTGSVSSGSGSFATSGGVAVGSQAQALGKSYASGNQAFAAAIVLNTASYGATGANAVAIGTTAKATAVHSVALGNNAQATHTSSTALGVSATTTAASQVALGGSGHTVRVSGAYNLPTTDGTTGQVLTTDGAGAVTFADAGGGGAALELYAENPVTFNVPSATGNNAVAVGDGASATATSAFAFGRAAQATANYSFCVGFGALASGTSSIAIGGGTDANSGQSTAIGLNSSGNGSQAVTGAGAMALGGSYASGTDSFAAAIANNTSSYGATGANSVAIGDRNKASGGYSVSLGRLNQSTASNSTSLGVYSVASSKYSLAVGYEASTRATPSISFSTGSYSGIAGQHQISMFVLRQRTTDGTSALLLADGATSGSIDDQIILPNNATFSFHGIIVARQQASAGTACAAWKIEGLIRREGSAGTTVLVNSATTVLDNTPAWGMALSADTTNGGLKIEVTGAAATNIAWNGNIHTSEVTY